MKIPPDRCPICRTPLDAAATGCGHCGFETLPSPLLAPPRRGQPLDPVLAAIAGWRAQAAQAPQDWRWPYLAGVGCLNLDLPEQGLDELRAAARLAPQIAATHLVLAGALVADPYRIDDEAVAEARALLERALVLAPALAPALALQRLLLARERSGQPQVAELMLRDAIASWPDCAVFPFELTAALTTAGELQAAEQVLREALTVCRCALPLHASLSLLRWRQGRFAEGRDSGQRGLQLAAEARARDVAVLHNNIALCLHGLADFAAARTHFEQALALDPHNASIAQNLKVLGETVVARRTTMLRRRWIGAAAAVFAGLALLVGIQVVMTQLESESESESESEATLLAAPTSGLAMPGPVNAASVISAPHGDDASYLIGLFEARNASRKVRSYRLTTLRRGTVAAVNVGYTEDGTVAATLGCLDMITVEPDAPDSGELPLQLCGYVIDGPPGGSARIWWGNSAGELAAVMDGQGFRGAQQAPAMAVQTGYSPR